MRLALAQMDIQWNCFEHNALRAEELHTRAMKGGADFTVFPEMFTSGFSLPLGEDALRAHRAGYVFLERTARDSGSYLAASIPKLAPHSPRPFNTLYCFGPEGLLGEYSKIHLISALGEDCHYAAGTSTFTTALCGFRVSFFICYDLRFPTLFSELAQETDLFIIAANWPEERQSHWETLLRARAIENQAYVAGVNRTGSGGTLKFAGGSMIIDPQGRTLARAGDAEEVIWADLDAVVPANYRHDFPALKDGRTAAGLRRR